MLIKFNSNFNPKLKNIFIIFNSKLKSKYCQYYFTKTLLSGDSLSVSIFKDNLFYIYIVISNIMIG